MNFSFADFGVLSRTVLGLTAITLVACTTTPHVSDSAVFDLSTSARRARFPKVQPIGVVELSGGRITSQPFQGSADQVEYLASGGAFLEKRVTPPIFAQASEILVTPDAAILRGRQAMVKKGGQIFKAEADTTQFVIDGTQVKIEGPHSIQDLASGSSKTIGLPPAPTPEPKPEAPKPAAIKKTVPQSVAEAPKPKPTASATSAPAVTKPQAQKQASAKPAPKKPAPTPAPKPAPMQTPKPQAKPEPKVDREKLLNLMREPSE